MLTGIHSNIVMGLLAALLWGGGDFSGGMGVKGAGGSVGAAVRIILLSHVTSLIILLAMAAFHGDAFPRGGPLLWGLSAGVTGGLSLTCFYIALSRGAMGAAAAVSGLLAAAIPASVATVTQGPPSILRLLGFIVAGIAIWMIASTQAGMTKPETSSTGLPTMILAVTAGAGFGVYFVCLKMAGSAGVIWPMGTARIGSISTCLALLFFLPKDTAPTKLNKAAVLWSMSTALLDTAGNLLYVASTRAGRLDVAAVLASLYPASTILLASWILKERFSSRQALGIMVAVVAVVMIASEP